MDLSVTSAQIRAARGLLNWSVRDLSERSGVHRNTITNIETGKSGGEQSTISAIRSALESSGVIFVAENGEGPGVRLKKGHGDEKG
jgi:transcriptional regulator with XRE-family HTH domain